MLNIWFGDVEGEKYIHNPDIWFNNRADKNWITGVLEREMIKDIDKTDVFDKNVLISPVFGGMPPSKLSGGVKTLILLNNVSSEDQIFNISACGNNCAKWILKIAERRDITVRLGYNMLFEPPFKIRILNTGDIVHNYSEYSDLRSDLLRKNEVMHV